MLIFLGGAAILNGGVAILGDVFSYWWWLVYVTWVKNTLRYGLLLNNNNFEIAEISEFFAFLYILNVDIS